MPEPHPLALRERLVAAYKRGGLTYAALAELFGVGEATVSRLLSRDRKTSGDLRPEPHGGGNPPCIPPNQFDALRVLVSEFPDATRLELCRIWEERFGVSLSVATMGRTLRDAGFTRKKSSSALRSSSGRTSSRSAKPSSRGRGPPTHRS